MSCDPEELCEECPEWIFTLADLLMCMMGLFVILWVLKPDVADSQEQATQNEIQTEEVILNINAAFGASPEDQEARRLRIEQLYRLLDKMKDGAADADGEKGRANRRAQGAEGLDPEVTSIRDGDLAGKGGLALFAEGDEALSDAAADQIEQVATKIRGFRNVVLVRGHAAPDDLPENIAAGEDARRFLFDLSHRRAVAVAEQLIESGVSPEILRVVACGGFEPVRRRAYGIDARQENRRVEVQATDQLASERAEGRAKVTR
jgi:outer membrane protein OmpA-like peptidoglycan-associated protein